MAGALKATNCARPAVIWAAFGLFVIFLPARLIVRPYVAKGLVADAMRYVDAMQAGDADVLYEYTSVLEREKGGLDRETFRKVFDRLVRPRLQRFRHFVSEQGELMGAGDEGVFWRVLENDDGRQLELGATIWASDEGSFQPGTISHLLRTAWYAEFMTEKSIPQPRAAYLRARIEGLKTDMAALAELGLRGIVTQSPVGRLLGQSPVRRLATWDEVLRNYEKRLAQVESGEQSSAPPATAPHQVGS